MCAYIKILRTKAINRVNTKLTRQQISLSTFCSSVEDARIASANAICEGSQANSWLRYPHKATNIQADDSGTVVLSAVETATPNCRCRAENPGEASRYRRRNRTLIKAESPPPPGRKAPAYPAGHRYPLNYATPEVAGPTPAGGYWFLSLFGFRAWTGGPRGRQLCLPPRLTKCGRSYNE
jgi:hypothetical protein